MKRFVNMCKSGKAMVAVLVSAAVIMVTFPGLSQFHASAAAISPAGYDVTTTYNFFNASSGGVFSGSGTGAGNNATIINSLKSESGNLLFGKGAVLTGKLTGENLPNSQFQWLININNTGTAEMNNNFSGYSDGIIYPACQSRFDFALSGSAVKPLDKSGSTWVKNDAFSHSNYSQLDAMDTYLDITYDLGGKTCFDSVHMWDHWNAVLRTYLAQVFVGDNTADLNAQTAKDAVLTFFNEEATNNGYHFTFNGDDKPTGRFLRVRVFSPNTPGSTQAALNSRVSEIAAFGTAVNTISLINDNTAAFPASEHPNQLLNQRPLYTVYKDGEKTYPAYDYQTDRLTDGDFTGAGREATYSGLLFADPIGGGNANVGTLYSDGTQRRLDMTWMLPGNIIPDKILMFSRQTSASVYLTGRYQLYLGNDLESLYSTDNMVYDFKNTAKSQRQIFTFETDLSYRYFGIRILDPVMSSTGDFTSIPAANIYTRLGEIALFGELDDDFQKTSLTRDNTAAFPDSEHSNRLLGQGPLYTVYQDGATTHPAFDFATGRLTDGNFATAAEYPDIKFADPIGGGNANVGTLYSDGTQRRLDMTWTLSGNIIPDKIMMFSTQLTSSIYLTERYQFYLGNDLDTLYDANNMVYDYRNTDNKTQRQVFNIETERTYRYFGISILDPVMSPDPTVPAANIYPRLGEVALFGEMVGGSLEDSLVCDNTAAFPASAFPNQLLNQRPLYAIYKDGETSYSAFEYATDRLTDGVFTNEASYPSVLFADPVSAGNANVGALYTDGSERYFDMSWTLQGNIVPEKIVVYSRQISTSIYLTGRYQLYLGNDPNTLYDAGNMVYDYENTNATQRQVFAVDTDQTYRYFGIRVLDPVMSSTGNFTTIPAANIYPRLGEVALFGEMTGDPIQAMEVKSFTGSMDQSTFDSYGDSLIKGQLANVFQNGSVPAIGSEKIIPLTDGIVSNTHTDWSQSLLASTDGSSWLDIIYTFGDAQYDITGFFFLGYNVPGNPGYNAERMKYTTGWYQVFVADDYDDLFLPEKMIYEYDYRTSKYGQSSGAYVKLDTSEIPRGSFFAVRILNPVSGATDYIQPRLTEIAVYGQEVEVIYSPVNLAKNMPVSVYRTDGRGVMTQLNANEFSVQDIKNLTDGDSNTFAQIAANGQRVDIVYNLCGDFPIDEIQALGLNGYSVYASTDINKLWSDSAENRYTGLNDTGIIFNPPVTIRYVRISIAPVNGAHRISEINIIGLDRYAFKNRNLALLLPNNNVSTVTENRETLQLTMIPIEPAERWRFMDRDKNNAVIGMQGGIPGADSLNTLFTFGDLRTINKINVFFTAQDGYWPTEMQLYVGETYEEVFGSDAKPLAVKNGFPDNGQFTAEFAPRLGRYVRVAVTKGNPDYMIYDEMCIGFTEVEIWGTAVKGTQTAEYDNRLLSFSDAATGISWSVMRIDPNDIFTGVFTSKLVQSPATNWQKTSLNKPPYMKIVGDTVYEVQFFDVTGKPVTDFGGRDIIVWVPMKASMNPALYLMGDATDRKAISIYDTQIADDELSVFSMLDKGKFKFVYVQMTTADDPYFKTIGPLEDFGDESPGTGDSGTSVVIMIAIVIASAALCVLLIYKRRKNGFRVDDITG